MKICSKCNVSKELGEFYKDNGLKSGLRKICKECSSKVCKEYKLKNMNKLKEKHKLNWIKIKDDPIRKKKKAEYDKEYSEKNKQKINERSKNNQKARRQVINEHRRNRRKTDIKYKLYGVMSTNIRDGLTRRKGGKNGNSWKNLVGYTVKELIDHLESKFTDGMNWENYGTNGWHIDHIIPSSYFEYDSMDHPAFKACWSLSNLQPLWATTQIAMSYGEDNSYIGNLDKNDKIIITKEIKELLDRVNT